MVGRPIEYVEVDVDKVLNERPMAIEILADGRRIWIPRKLVQRMDHTDPAFVRVIEVPETWAKSEGLI